MKKLGHWDKIMFAHQPPDQSNPHRIEQRRDEGGKDGQFQDENDDSYSVGIALFVDKGTLPLPERNSIDQEPNEDEPEDVHRFEGPVAEIQPKKKLLPDNGIELVEKQAGKIQDIADQ